MATGQLAIVVQHIHTFAGSTAFEDSTDGQLLERFLADGEEAAFASLVRRHGPMVLGVCRRVLRDRHAAEDAFQATFLVLLRRARFLDRRGSVASWLYTVAYHVALRARAEAARRQRQERPVLHPPEPGWVPTLGWTDLQPILDEELQRLPDTYRAVVVLCYLEGKTNTQASQLLHWPVGTVKGRLARARTLLRDRLTRRGITLAGGLLSATLTERASAALSPCLVQSTLRTVLPAGGGAPSAAARALADGALRTMSTTKLKTILAVLVLAGVVALGVGTSTPAVQAQRQEAPQLKTQPFAGPSRAKPPTSQLTIVPGKAKGPGRAEELALAGRVLNADGKVVVGAQVVVIAWRPGKAGEKPRVLAQARSDWDGKFALKVRAPSPAHALVALASAPGHALAWHWQLPDRKAEIRLQPAEVRRGRLIDLQGQPAAGVKLDVVRLGARGASNGMKQVTLTDFDADGLDEEDVRPVRNLRMSFTLKGGAGMAGNGVVEFMGTPASGKKTTSPGLILPDPPVGLAAWPASVTTDAEGRFEVRGIPRGQGAGLRVRDPRFALQLVNLPAPEKGKAAAVTCVLSPSRLLEGTVTDTLSGKPVPHARVRVFAPSSRVGFVLTTAVRFRSPGGLGGADIKGRQGMGKGIAYMAFADTWYGLMPDDADLPPLEVQADEQGRFRLNLFHSDSYTLRVAAPPGEPYLGRTLTVRWPQRAVVRREQKVELVRGVPVRGRVTEAPGGKPVAGARVDFWSRGLALPQGVRHPHPVKTGPDGSFRALLPPARWHVVVNGPEPVYLYQPIRIDKLVEEQGAGGKRASAGAGDKPRQASVGQPTSFYELDALIRAANVAQEVPAGPPTDFYPDAWTTLDLKAGDRARALAVTLRRAPLLRGRVVGPDGKPAEGALLFRRPALGFDGAARMDTAARQLWLDLMGRPPVLNEVLFEAGDWGANGQVFAPVELRDGTFAIPALSPKAAYPLLFLDPTRKLGGVVGLPGKQAGGEPVTVRLSPCGTARARFLDARGKPLADYQPLLSLLLPPGPHPVPGSMRERTLGALRGPAWSPKGQQKARRDTREIATDAEGRVTLSGLIPGGRYRLFLGEGKARDFTVPSGTTLDLGELTAVRPPGARPPTPAKEGDGSGKTKGKPAPSSEKTP
jgi:RNA polymerase sigma factor (sigma-70 family)